MDEHSPPPHVSVENRASRPGGQQVSFSLPRHQRRFVNLPSGLRFEPHLSVNISTGCDHAARVAAGLDRAAQGSLHAVLCGIPRCAGSRRVRGNASLSRSRYPRAHRIKSGAITRCDGERAGGSAPSGAVLSSHSRLASPCPNLDTSRCRQLVALLSVPGQKGNNKYGKVRARLVGGSRFRGCVQAEKAAPGSRILMLGDDRLLEVRCLQGIARKSALYGGRRSTSFWPSHSSGCAWNFSSLPPCGNR